MAAALAIHNQAVQVYSISTFPFYRIMSSLKQITCDCPGAGANYGWPAVEHGDCKEYERGPFQGPVYWYPQSSINGGDFCRHGSNWPEIWQGRYFFADFVQGWIKALDPDHPKDIKTFGRGFRRPVDLRFAPDGSLYLLLRNAWVIDDKFEPSTGSLLRIER